SAMTHGGRRTASHGRAARPTCAPSREGPRCRAKVGILAPGTRPGYSCGTAPDLHRTSPVEASTLRTTPFAAIFGWRRDTTTPAGAADASGRPGTPRPALAD